MIKELNNPLSGDYIELKNFISSCDFPWFRFTNTTHNINDDSIEMFSHTFLERPEANKGYSKANSPYIDGCIDVVKQILIANNIKFDLFFRLSCNLVFPTKEVRKTSEHVDHEFFHKNILIYLSDSDGDTVVENQIYKPREDSAIIFSGKHYHYTPSQKNRIVLVGTFL
jgi:hypothetical protein|tara:strand:- start:627 stop:1133 length:507 start_codon:yes stop_codon:yes gene_type:complete